jgi:hypothetical protein
MISSRIDEAPAMAKPIGGPIAKTKTVPYDVAEHLRTPEEMAAYLAAWLQEAPEDAEGIARALGDIARAHRLVQATENPADPEAAAKSELDGWRRVYEGLSESEIAEVEAIALDRSNFFRKA